MPPKRLDKSQRPNGRKVDLKRKIKESVKKELKKPDSAEGGKYETK